jgi:pimeloyl-ACP methyl ester carboxylesterase
VRYLYGDQRSTPYYHALARRLESANSFFTTRELAGVPHGAHLSHPDVLAGEIRDAFDHAP